MNGLEKAIQQLRTKDPKLLFELNADRSAVTILRGSLGAVSADKLKKAPLDVATKFISDHRALFGGVDQAKSLALARIVENRRGMVHVVLQQKHGAAVVYGGRVSLHYGEDGILHSVSSSLIPNIDLPDKAKVSAADAAKSAVKHAGKGAELFKGKKPVLTVATASALQIEGKQPFLCWQLPVITPENKESHGWIYFVDALDGKVLFRYASMRTGTGKGHYSAGSSLNSESSGSTFRLRDATTSTGWTVAPKPAVHTYDDNGGTSFTLADYSLDPNDKWDNGGTVPTNRKDNQEAEVDLHRYLGYVLAYYYLVHGHNGWDGNGSDIKGHSHNEYLGNNAFWYGLYEQVYFADGNGTTRDIMCPLDTVAHEYTHGIKFYYDVLQTYSGETGALDEATSDLFGAFVVHDYAGEDPQTWEHGNLYRIDGTRGRNMADPSRDSSGVVRYDTTSEATKYSSSAAGYYPDHYSIRYMGANDYNGVHLNCPIVTHAVYLMVNGGTHRLSNVSVTGMGIGPIEQILFDVLSAGDLSNSSTFADFRVAMINSCMSLYPEDLDYLASIKSGFRAVGIGPDLYVRDTLTDQGDEPGTLSCLSPDIMVRNQLADVTTLGSMSDTTNGSLCEDIAFNSSDSYVYFRVFNRGAAAASGTFRLFISPASSFTSPAVWTEVGHYDFPDVPAEGGVWVPTAANQCITFTAALKNTLGKGHFCFIGILESATDPAPDRNLISDLSEYYSFITSSNNYVWRNCDIINVQPNENILMHTLAMRGFKRVKAPRRFEIDARNLPSQAKVAILFPKKKFAGVKLYDSDISDKVGLRKTAGAIEPLPSDRGSFRALPLEVVAQPLTGMLPQGMTERALAAEWQALVLPPGKALRLEGFRLADAESIDVRLVVKFPAGIKDRDVTLTTREFAGNNALGQFNFIYRFRSRVK